MLRTMLVGLDGSADSEAALDLGLRWAKRLDAMLVGMGIIDEPEICEPEPVPLGGGYYKARRDQVLLNEARRKADEILGRFGVRCAEAGVACKELEEVGLPAEEIVTEAQRFDLILLGQKTHFSPDGPEAGDQTLSRVLSRSPRPVVAVPRTLTEGESVVIAFDGSLQAARALHLFEASGLGNDRKVHIVSVSKEKPLAARHAERAADFLRAHEISVQSHPVDSSDPASALLEAIGTFHAELLVMGAYGQASWREFFLGSVTRTLLKESPVPLFLYH